MYEGCKRAASLHLVQARVTDEPPSDFSVEIAKLGWNADAWPGTGGIIVDGDVSAQGPKLEARSISTCG